MPLLIMNYNNNIATLSKAMNIPYKMNNHSKPSNHKKPNIFKNSNMKFIKANKFDTVRRHRFNYQNRPKMTQRFVKY